MATNSQKLDIYARERVRPCYLGPGHVTPHTRTGFAAAWQDFVYRFFLASFVATMFLYMVAQLCLLKCFTVMKIYHGNY